VLTVEEQMAQLMCEREPLNLEALAPSGPPVAENVRYLRRPEHRYRTYRIIGKIDLRDRDFQPLQDGVNIDPAVAVAA
jgi:hypothetical protein